MQKIEICDVMSELDSEKYMYCVSYIHDECDFLHKVLDVVSVLTDDNRFTYSKNMIRIDRLVCLDWFHVACCV